MDGKISPADTNGSFVSGVDGEISPAGTRGSFCSAEMNENNGLADAGGVSGRYWIGKIKWR